MLFAAAAFVLLYALLIGSEVFLPSRRNLSDLEVVFEGFASRAAARFSALGLFSLLLIALGGWAERLRLAGLSSLGAAEGWLLAFAAAAAGFATAAAALGFQGLLHPLPLGLLLLPGIAEGFRLLRRIPRRPGGIWEALRGLPAAAALAAAAVLWAAELLAPPLLWDAVSDHFRFAKECARLGAVPPDWSNHMGLMPKLHGAYLAACFSLGGEALARLAQALPALLLASLGTLWCRRWFGSGETFPALLATSPYFLTVFAGGYAEGWRCFLEILAAGCLIRAAEERDRSPFLPLAGFFLGAALSVKYTAVFAAAGCLALAIFLRIHPRRGEVSIALGLLLVPLLPWLLRSGLATGNPVYPLGAGFHPFLSSGEGAAWYADTDPAAGASLPERLRLQIAVWLAGKDPLNAVLTPLFYAGLAGLLLRARGGTSAARGWLVFAAASVVPWTVSCSALRHAAGTVLALSFASAAGWVRLFTAGGAARQARWLFAAASAAGAWLCFTAQSSSTAPYLAAVGLEPNEVRLRRHYLFHSDTLAAYAYLDRAAHPREAVMVLGQFQAYPLEREAVVDLLWHPPRLLEWAGKASAAGALAEDLRRRGTAYLLYAREEALHMAHRTGRYGLKGMEEGEYRRFLERYAEPVWALENTTVYRLRREPLPAPRCLDQAPGIQEPLLVPVRRAEERGETGAAWAALRSFRERLPGLGIADVVEARLRAGEGDCAGVLRAGRRALACGLELPSLLSTMVRCSLILGDEATARDYSRRLGAKEEELERLLDGVPGF